MFEKSVLSRSREKDQSSLLFFLPWFVPTIFLFQIASCLPRAFSLRLLLRVEKKESGGCRCCQDYVRAFRIPRIIALSGDTIGESGDNRIMLILLRRYSFIPDVARVTSERISKFSLSSVYYLERGRERELFHFLENLLGRLLFSCAFIFTPPNPFASLSSVSFYRIIRDKAVSLLIGIRPFGYPRPWRENN